jgi:hypothetical protein
MEAEGCESRLARKSKPTAGQVGGEENPEFYFLVSLKEYSGHMKHAFLILLLALSAVMVRGAPREGKADLPFRWGGSSSPNMVSNVKDLPADPGSAEPLWELRLGSHTYSIPTIDRGRIYLGANDAGVQRPGFKPTGGYRRHWRWSP